ncbi:hypothetical protein BV25DRAFT_1835462 [Artomyces pyxidatus]|uniref:Uncharacterized protein n=1 Tax=Artomyces pyxidatus TaxID=48021 RepID=A0ACB8TD43_9AGAM|nr:hypothetical protein BV25DRAFT_1835462 [Artomyces pyxidatus]
MQSGTKRRFTTVHDFAALRLHPDGSRVPTELAPSQHTSHFRTARRTAKDARGNLIAKDAAGPSTVKKRRRAVADDDAGVGEKPDDDTREQVREEVGSEAEEDGKVARKRRRREKRTQKLREFENDMEFLSTAAPSVKAQSERAVTAVSENSSRQDPSSDLLKCIHYFASHYYTAQDMLIDKSRQYRREKQERKRKKEEQDELFAAEEEDSDDDVVLKKRGNDDDEWREGGEELERAKDGDGDQERDEDPEDASDMVQDMYKALEGSALMAIGAFDPYGFCRKLIIATLGMLMQEFVAGLVKPNIPVGWEEEYGDREQNTGDSDHDTEGVGGAVNSGVVDERLEEDSDEDRDAYVAPSEEDDDESPSE